MSNPFQHFIGVGDEQLMLQRTNRPIASWRPYEGASSDAGGSGRDHPAGYIASPELVAAVNTALLLGKPLLLTGNPGTGKSQLADRIAWEFSLGHVLRFEAQSTSEAQDLFYRFDLVRHLAHLQRLNGGRLGATPRPEEPRSDVSFVTFGPLGKAILRAAQVGDGSSTLVTKQQHRALLEQAFPAETPATWTATRSVVLIDEIDKASRDFPNDLLNAIERLEFRIAELPLASGNVIRTSDDESLRPIVVVTSNGERELPAPFLRRCVFFNIESPDPDTLRQIVWNRVLSPQQKGPPGRLPPLYEDILACYQRLRSDGQPFVHQPGTGELLDWYRAIARFGYADIRSGLDKNRLWLLQAISAVAKSKNDRTRLIKIINDWNPGPALQQA